MGRCVPRDDGVDMKNVVLGTAMGLVLAGGVATAQEDSLYVKAGLGYGAPGEMDVEQPFSSNTDVGLVYGVSEIRPLLALGYDMAGPWRVELESVQRYNTLSTWEWFPGMKADLNSVALMANVLHDFDSVAAGPLPVTPYLGAGLGVARTRFSVADSVSNATHKETSLAGQVLGGVDVGLTDRLSADLGARYFMAGDNDSTFNGVPQTLFTPHSVDVFLSLKYTFGTVSSSSATKPKPAPTSQPAAQTAPPPPPSTAEPAPAPVIACDDVTFVVYFGWDSAELTIQARQVVANAADQASACDITRVTIEGHTDRSGTASYNARLSQRRANVVRAALIDEGVAAGLIGVSSKGEGSGAKPTADGVREPLNRRSEVVIAVAN